MPVGQTRAGGAHRQRIVRRVVAVRGSMGFHTEIAPRFDYGRAVHEIDRHEHGVAFRTPELSLQLETDVPIELRDGAARAHFHLQAGESTTFVLETLPPGSNAPAGHTDAEIEELFERTVAYWRRWLAQSRYTGRWREMVHRSALTLKLLTYQPTGAIIAAPTTSLPEELGGERNWDYRYTWIRDAAFSLYALLRLGFAEEASAFMQWLTLRLSEERDRGHGSGRCRSCTASTVAASYRRRSSDTWRDIGLGAGADRQRRRRPAPAGHLRRADRLGLSLQQARSTPITMRHGSTSVGSWTGCASTGTRPTRGFGRCAEDARTSPLAPDVVGGGRARRADRQPARAAGQPRALALRPR